MSVSRDSLTFLSRWGGCLLEVAAWQVEQSHVDHWVRPPCENVCYLWGHTLTEGRVWRLNGPENGDIMYQAFLWQLGLQCIGSTVWPHLVVGGTLWSQVGIKYWAAGGSWGEALGRAIDVKVPQLLLELLVPNDPLDGLLFLAGLKISVCSCHLSLMPSIVQVVSGPAG